MPDLDPLAYISRYESDNLPFVGYGGSDLTNAPRGPFGFPLWNGVKTRYGMTHAAGLGQIEPDLWNEYAARLNIKDFSVTSQLAIMRAVYNDLGFSPWAPYDPRLAAAIVSAKGRFI